MRMQMDIAPMLCECHLLGRRNLLVTEKDHAMIQQHLIDCAETVVIRRPRQIDVADFRTHAAGERPDVQWVEGVGCVETLIQDSGNFNLHSHAARTGNVFPYRRAVNRAKSTFRFDSGELDHILPLTHRIAPVYSARSLAALTIGAHFATSARIAAAN
jgi:hypothetical protein